MTTRLRDNDTLSSSTAGYSIWDALLSWRSALKKTTLHHSTQKSYLAGVVQLIKRGVIDSRSRIDGLDKDWSDAVFTGIKKTEWTRHTKTYRITGLKAFLDHVAYISTEGTGKPPVPIDKIPPPHLITADQATFEDLLQIETFPIDHWLKVIDALWEVSKRDTVVVAVIWETCQNLDSVLSLYPGDVEDSVVHFKKAGAIKTDKLLTNLLKLQQGSVGEPIFRTCTGKPLRRNQVVRNLALAAERAGTDVRVTPKIWLATARLDQMPHGLIIGSILEKSS